MKNLKSITLFVIVTVALVIGCRKESLYVDNNIPTETSSIEKGFGGIVSTDPNVVEKIPLVMSQQYLANQTGLPINILADKGGNRDATPPVVSITSPSNNATVSGTITISVNATDNVGVSSVVCYIDNNLLATDPTAPFAFTWITTSYPGGTHIIKVTAKDAANNRTSSSVQVTVYNSSTGGGGTTTGDITPPNVNVTSPSNGSSYVLGTTLTLSATATDNVGVKSVGYKLDGQLSYITTTPPYSTNWLLTNMPAGIHTVQAVATDSAGNQGLSSIISITLNTTIVTPPVGGVPSSFLLSTPGSVSQGSEGSCMAFAVTSAASIEWKYRNNMSTYSTLTNIMSPEYVYNYGLSVPGDCSAGSSLQGNMAIIRDSGVCTWSMMPYTSGTCAPNVNDAQRVDAASHKIIGSARMLRTDSTAIKQALYANHPIIIGIGIDNNFYNAGPGYIWRTYGTYIAGHGIIVVGWDDSKHAYKIMNSWGTGWGDAGFLWVDYDIFYNYSSYYVYYFN